MPASLNAPTGAWCSLTPSADMADYLVLCLNAPTGAWCSLTGIMLSNVIVGIGVSMHLQVRGAP